MVENPVSMSTTWGMSMGFLGSFLAAGYHTHYILHIGLGYTLLAMLMYVALVVLGLCLNLWFMAGQRLILEALALYEPTSCIMEWLHDSVFGIDEDRLAGAYTVGKHQGRRTKDGKKYIQLLVPRRTIPYPCSIGGAIHYFFFSCDNPHDPDQAIVQMFRSLMAISITVLFLQTMAMEWLFHADALFVEALDLQGRGLWDAAVDRYISVIKQDPFHSPHVTAMHNTHLIQVNPHAAGMYLLGASFQAQGDFSQAALAFEHVVEHVPHCSLAIHSLHAVAPGISNSSSLRARLESDWKYSLSDYVIEAFDAYAPQYEHSMRQLSFRAPELLVSTLKDVMQNLELDRLGKVVDLGCGSGLLGEQVREITQELVCFEMSGKMLAVAKEKQLYDRSLQINILDAFNAQQDFDAALGSDVLPYFANVDKLMISVGQSLKSGALLGFTVEALDLGSTSGEGEAMKFKLLPSGRYAHHKEYIRKEVERANFELLAVGDGPLRWQHGRPVAGHVFVARRK